MKRWVALLSLLVSAPGFAQPLAEDLGVELHGTIAVEALGVGECNVIAENHSAGVFERIRGNQGKPMTIYRADISVFNGSGRALDHLIANYSIDAVAPDCTNWGSVDYSVDSSGTIGHIQATATPYSVAPGETLTDTKYIIVLSGDPAPIFRNWFLTFHFADIAPEDIPQVSASDRAPTATASPPPVPPCEAAVRRFDCWLELQSHPGCFVWGAYALPYESVTWSGRCDDRFAQGNGMLTLTNRSDDSWYTTLASGTRVDGKWHGTVVQKSADGTVQETPFVDGTANGAAVMTEPDGTVWEIPYVNGEWHGIVIVTATDGRRDESHWVNGALDCEVWRRPDGSVESSNCD